MKKFIATLLIVTALFSNMVITADARPSKNDNKRSTRIEKLDKKTPSKPTAPQTEEPTVPPTEEPTVPPTEEPTVPPTEEPTAPQTEEPTVPPTEEPTVPPTEEPTVPPTEEPIVPEIEEPIINEDVVYFPEELLVDNPVNPSFVLENFLNSSSNKKVVFPEGKTFILESQLVIHDVENLEIDFNGSTIQLPNRCAWKARYDTGEYVPLSAITVHSSSNITFSNYTVDGNSSNISADQWCIGLWLSDVDGFVSNNGSFKYCNYHQVVINSGTKDINFNGTYFKDHGGASTPAGISDVFVANDPDDNLSFIDTTVDNTALRDRQAQLFYIAGYNGLFDTVTTNNCSVPLDVRKGTHVARNFTVTNGEMMLMVQPYPNNSTEFANLTASNFVGTNITGNNISAAGVYIVGCEKVHLDNFKIELDSAAKYSWYGIRIRKYYEEYPLENVVITNTEILNSEVSGVIMEKLTKPVTLKNITSVNTPSGIKETACTVNHSIENLVKI